MKILELTLIITAMSTPAFSKDLPEVDKISTSAGDVELCFVGHGSLMFKVNNYVIHIDPVRSMGEYDKLPKADLILVTHDHYDHLDKELISDLRKQNTILFCNQGSSAGLSWAQAMKEGDKKAVNDFTVEAVPAYNIVHERAKGQPFHPEGVGLGYILSIGDKRFYVAGDTENIPEMKELKNIDIAFLPMNLPYTMSPEMVADAARSFKPKILYPYHFGDTDTGILAELLKDTDIEIRIRKLN